jgi:hypothetical protein
MAGERTGSDPAGTRDREQEERRQDAPNATSEDEELVKELRQRLQKRRWLIERNWWGNILYFLGIQWIVYDTNARRWRQRKLSPAVPTPITNVFRSTLDTVKSALAQHEPRFVGMPERDDPHAVAAAQAADEYLGVILAEGNFRKAKRRNLDWLTLTGNGFIEVVWDDSPENGVDALPYDECHDCQAKTPPGTVDPVTAVCPKCGSRRISESKDAFVMVPRGAIRFDVKSPFEVFMDPVIEELEDQPHVIFVESYAVEQVQQKWGYTVAPDQGYTTQSGQLRQTAGTLAAPGIGIPFSAMAAMDRENRMTVIRLFSKRNKKYPEGCYIVMTANGKLLEKHTKYPWRYRGTGRKYFPFVHFRFGTVGGRAWGYTPADDLLPKQYQLNKAESLFTLIMTRMANPVWLIPTNTNPTRITGEIGIQIEYTPVGTQIPTRIPGMDAPASLVQYIERIYKSFDELSGAFDAVRGRTMGTRTPVGTVQTLADRGFGRWATVFGNLEESYEDIAKKALEVWRANAKTPRVKAVKDALGAWTFKEFLGADWAEGVDIEVEAGSTRPRTQQQKLSTYIQLGQLGLLNLQDQGQVVKILQDTGLQNLLPGVEEDTKAAYKENSDFMQWATSLRDFTADLATRDPMAAIQGSGIEEIMQHFPLEVRPLVDEHAVHFLTHRRFAMTDEFKHLPKIAQELFYEHMGQHQHDLLASKIFMMAAGMPQQGISGNKPSGSQPKANASQNQPGP